MPQDTSTPETLTPGTPELSSAGSVDPGALDFTAHIRVNRATWEKYGELVGIGRGGTGGRSRHVAAFIEREVRRIEQARGANGESG